MPKASNPAFERSRLRWEEPPAGKPANRSAKLVALSLGLGVTFAGGVAAAMLTLGPAEAERQVQLDPLRQAEAAPAPSASAEPERAAEPALPVKKVKTVPVLAQAAAAPAKPPEPAPPAQASATPAAVMSLARLVAPAKGRWASNLAAVRTGSAAIDGTRFAAVSALPFVAEPMLEAPAEDAEPQKAERRTRMAQSANLRARPANGGRTLGVLSAGTSIALIGCGRGWCEVSADGRRGFVAERFLKGKAAPAKRKKAARKKKGEASPTPAAEASAQAETLPGALPEPVIPEPSDR